MFSISMLLYFHPSLKETFKYFSPVILGERPFCLFTISIHSTPLKIQFTPSPLFYKEVRALQFTQSNQVGGDSQLVYQISVFVPVSPLNHSHY